MHGCSLNCVLNFRTRHLQGPRRICGVAILDADAIVVAELILIDRSNAIALAAYERSKTTASSFPAYRIEGEDVIFPGGESGQIMHFWETGIDEIFRQCRAESRDVVHVIVVCATQHRCVVSS